MFMEILMQEECGVLAVSHLHVFGIDAVTYVVQVLPWANTEAMPHGSACALWSTQNYKDILYETNEYFSYLISSYHYDVN